MVDRLVYESKKFKVFRRQEDGLVHGHRVVKVLNYEFPTPADIACSFTTSSTSSVG